MVESSATSGAGLVYSTLDRLLYQQHAARLLLQKGYYRKTTKQTGSHQVRQLGRGMEFAESRLYCLGDDIRSMDWKVTARTGKPHTKLFEEERERPVMLWCDLRPAMFFATQGRFKSVVMAELAALLSWRSWLSGDRVGSVIFSAAGHQDMRPARSKSKVLQFLSRLAEATKKTPDLNAKSSVDLQQTWERIRRVLSAGSQVVLLSDFRGINEAAEKQLKYIASHSRLTLIVISDPFEHQLPKNTQLRLSDGLRFVRLNTHHDKLRQAYQATDLSHAQRLKQLAITCRAQLIEISTQDSHSVLLGKLKEGGL